MDKMLKKLKEKYLKDKEFKKEFDKDKEKAIEKYFGKVTLNQLKVNVGNMSKANVDSFLSNRDELDDKALEGIAGGKGEEKKKREVIKILVPVIQEKEINNIKMTPTVKKNLTINKGTFDDF